MTIVRCCLALLLALFYSTPMSMAFQIPTTGSIVTAIRDVSPPRTTWTTTTTTVLQAKKKAVPSKSTSDGEKNNALQLFVLYMTPWRNPNSIFVYMFLTLYLLGEYSEAKKVAAQAAASVTL